LGCVGGATKRKIPDIRVLILFCSKFFIPKTKTKC